MGAPRRLLAAVLVWGGTERTICAYLVVCHGIIDTHGANHSILPPWPHYDHPEFEEREVEESGRLPIEEGVVEAEERAGKLSSWEGETPAARIEPRSMFSTPGFALVWASNEMRSCRLVPTTLAFAACKAMPACTAASFASDFATSLAHPKQMAFANSARCVSHGGSLPNRGCPCRGDPWAVAGGELAGVMNKSQMPRAGSWCEICMSPSSQSIVPQQREECVEAMRIIEAASS